MQRWSIKGGTELAAKARHLSASIGVFQYRLFDPTSTAYSECTCVQDAAISSGLGRRFKSTRPAVADEDDVEHHHHQHYNESPLLPTLPLHDWKFRRTLVSSSPRPVRTTESSKMDPLPPVTARVLPITKTAPQQQQPAPAAATTRTQPNSMTYVGTNSVPITSVLHIVTPKEGVPSGIWPAFRMMDEDGSFRDPTYDGTEQQQRWPVPSTISPATDSLSAPEAATNFLAHLNEAYPHYTDTFDQTKLFQLAKDARTSFSPCLDDNQDQETHQPLFLRAHRHMLRVREMDKILENSQRQGRIAFYMTCTGEEAIHMGSASALELQDHVLVQYREQGVLMWRGFSLEQFTNQCFSNDRDLGKARQMPIHYGSRALNYHTVSSPLGTQIPQAVGVAYRFKMMKKDNVAVCYFGEGCSSTPDFHSGLNFAATLKAPVIFFCRNNGYAISTPTEDQYAGDGVVARGPGYGIASIRVDGNDIFAVHAAVRAARKYVLENDGAPVLIEAMTYRAGHHSTSDDSSRYRDSEAVNRCSSHNDPVLRFENFLLQHGWLTNEKIGQMKETERKAVLKAIEQAERRPKPPLETLFTDVYHEVPPHLQDQQNQLTQHLDKYGDKYA